MEWGTDGETAKVTNWKDLEVSHRSFGDNHKKQKTNAPSNVGCNAWRTNTYNDSWTAAYWKYEDIGTDSDVNREVADSSYGRRSSGAS